MTERENYLRSIEFRHPEWIPCRVDLSPGTWRTFREELEEMVRLAKERLTVAQEARVVSCYEAGQDGFYPAKGLSVHRGYGAGTSTGR